MTTVHTPAAGSRPVVLIFVGNYLPAHKAGGIIRTVVNTVDHLCDEFDFRIVTGDRDLGDDRPFDGVPLNQWVSLGNSLVYYMPKEQQTMANLAALVNSVPARAIYLNSFFDPFTVKVLANMWRGTIPPTRVIVAPRGEFAWASLKQKYPKKLIFMLGARLIRLYGPAIFHASSKFEADDIVREMHVNPASILVAFDFALKVHDTALPPPAREPGDDRLRMLFLSRVAREKNLDFALKLLRDVRSQVIFDIHGPVNDTAYWEECQALMAQLPPNVTARYCGPVDAGKVVETFANYDLFLFPTGGEAYGHVIVESLLAGTPVLASQESAWRDLPSDGLGWDVNLADQSAFVQAIEAFAAVPPAERDARRSLVRAGVARRLADPAIAESHRRLLLG